MSTVPEAELLPFLDAILAEPDADGPKLVLADFLEERGDGRGPLLREGMAWLARVREEPIPAVVTKVHHWYGWRPGPLSPRRARLFAVACLRWTPTRVGHTRDWVSDPRTLAAVVAAEL